MKTNITVNEQDYTVKTGTVKDAKSNYNTYLHILDKDGCCICGTIIKSGESKEFIVSFATQIMSGYLNNQNNINF